jgi:phytoene dehydrogenase-like protein
MNGAAFDTIVVGAGHNGLVCAAKLARAGQKVLVLEARDHVGGLCSTREFAPGFHASSAHVLYGMPEELIRELELDRHGLRYAARGLPTIALGPERSLRIDADRLMNAAASDTARWPAFASELSRFGRFLSHALKAAPPRLGVEKDRWALAHLGLRLRLLGRRDMREFLRIIGMNVHDLATDEFSDPLLKAALGFDATLGTNFGPRSPGTVLTLLHRWAIASMNPMGLTLPVGGMGTVTRALLGSAEAAGATVRTGTPVRRFIVADDRVVGVELASGESWMAKTVVSNADPRRTFFDLLGTEHLDTGFVRRVDHYRCRGLTARLNLALDRLPTFRHVDAVDHGARILIAPTLEDIEKAFDASKYGELPPHPVLEVLLPTVHDASLAPEGRHILSANVQFAPTQTKNGWAEDREPFLRTVLATLESYAPGLGASIIAEELLTPADLENDHGVTGGHWHHGELAFDQFLMVRPVPGAAQYATPISGLYLCGAGSHPGGGVTGLPGRLAAERILRDAR